MSADEMKSILNEIGVEAHVTVREVPTTHRVPRYRTYTTEPKSDDGGQTTYTETWSGIVDYEDMPGVI